MNVSIEKLADDIFALCNENGQRVCTVRTFAEAKFLQLQIALDEIEIRACYPEYAS